jgi:hypothetical protein
VSLRPHLTQNVLAEEDTPCSDELSEEDWVHNFSDKDCMARNTLMNKRRKEIMAAFAKVPWGFEGIIQFNNRASVNNKLMQGRGGDA